MRRRGGNRKWSNRGLVFPYPAALGRTYPIIDLFILWRETRKRIIDLVGLSPGRGGVEEKGEEEEEEEEEEQDKKEDEPHEEESCGV